MMYIECLTESVPILVTHCLGLLVLGAMLSLVIVDGGQAWQANYGDMGSTT